MQLRAGQRLASAVSDTEVVVVRAPDGDVEVGCGGAPMVEVGQPRPADATLDASLGEPTAIGKRYADEAAGLEVLCTKAGEGALTLNGNVLLLKGAKPLPSSD
jgi:hypothetical protein